MLSIAHLTHVYPNGTRALDDVTLTVPRGMFGLLGPNGAGKSTLMRAIATLQIPTGGSITLEADGRRVDVLREPQALRGLLGYLPQDFGVYPRVSALEMLDHLAVLKGIGERRVRKEVVEGLLAQVNLWEVRKKALAGFSGGMRQRFGIAQALIGSPKLIIVDEPTAGLDPDEIGQNVVVILSTHIVDDVTDLCSRMAIIAGGRIVREGVPHDLIAGLAGRIWRRTIERSELDAFRAGHEVISTRLSEGRTMVHVVADSSPGAGFERVDGTLEDVYFATLAEQRRRPALAAAA
jgi:ABC-2 type transport system ATP-binding protein